MSMFYVGCCADAAYSDWRAKYTKGDIIYFYGYCSGLGIDGNTAVTVYDTAWEVYATPMASVPYTFGAGAVYLEDINGGPVSIDTTAYAVGGYIVEWTVTGGGTWTSYSQFSVEAASAAPVITSPALSDYAITTDETTTASCVITNSPTWVAVWINGKVHRLTLSSTADTYRMALSGEHIGACTASSVMFTATNADGGVQATAPSTITVSETPMTSTGSIEKSPYAMIELLRANVPLVQKRVYHLGEGVLVSAQMPRITVSVDTPGREDPWLGEKWGTRKRAVMKNQTIRIDIWDKNPKVCEQIAADVECTIWKNRGYHPTDETYGYFVNMFIAGGTTTRLDPALQLYRRTINVSATWLDINTY